MAAWGAMRNKYRETSAPSNTVDTRLSALKPMSAAGWRYWGGLRVTPICGRG